MAFTYNVFTGNFDFYEPATAGSGGVIGGSITGGTPDSVLFVSASGNLGQDNNQFYFQDSATTPTTLAANANVALSLNTAGDFTGTDPLDVYGQGDFYQVNSVINGGSGQAANLLLDNVVPGISLSSSRGTGASPVNLNTGDFIGTVTGYGYTNSAYTAATAMVSAVRGTTSTNLGGELQFWTRTNAGTLTQALTIGNTQFVGIGQPIPSAQIHTAGAISAAAWTTLGIGLRIDGVTYTDTTSSGTVAQVTVHNIGAASIAASSATTITNPVGLSVSAPNAGTNVTYTNSGIAFVSNGKAQVITSSGAGFLVGSALSSATPFFLVSGNSSGRIGIGTNPAAVLHIAAQNTAISTTAWTTNGIALRIDPDTYTDTTSSGTVAQNVGILLGAATFAASSVTTYTTAVGVNIKAPVAGTNVTFGQTPTALYVQGNTFIGTSSSNAFIVGNAVGGTAQFIVSTGTTGLVGVGTASPAAKLHLNGNSTNTAWTTSGIGLRADAATYTDSSTATGTIGTEVIHSLGQGTIAATNASVVITNSATLYIPSAPTAGTNVTLTNAYSLWVGSGGGNSRFDSVLFASSQLGVGSGGSVQDSMFYLVNGRTSTSALGTAGKGIQVVSTTYTDGVTTTGTLANGVAHSFGTPTFAFGSGSATVTNAATVYIANAPQPGTGATITNSYALWMAGGILRADGGQVGGVRVVTAAGAVTVTTSDYTIVVNKTVGAATTVNLPASPLTGTVFYVKDGKGDAATNNITLTPAAGNIDGAGTLVINANYGGYQLVYNGTAWNIV